MANSDKGNAHYERLARHFLFGQMSKLNYPLELLEIYRVGPSISPYLSQMIMEANLTELITARVRMAMNMLYVWERPELPDIVKKLAESDDFGLARSASEFIGQTCTSANIESVIHLIQVPVGQIHRGAIIEGLAVAAERGVFTPPQRERLFETAKVLWPPNIDEVRPGDDTFSGAFISVCPWKAEELLTSDAYLSADPATVRCGTTYLALAESVYRGFTLPIDRVLDVGEGLWALMADPTVDQELRDVACNTMEQLPRVFHVYRHTPALSLFEELNQRTESHIRDEIRNAIAQIISSEPQSQPKQKTSSSIDLIELAKKLPAQEMVRHLMPRFDLFLD